MPRAFVTNITSNTRLAMIGLLNQQLADAIDAKLAIKQAHWNMRGPSFIGVHEFLDTVAARLEGQIDTIAERVVQLGGTAAGTVQAVARATTLPAYSIDATDQTHHVQAVADRLATLAGTCRKGVETATEAGDAVSADILTEAAAALDKDCWLVGAHLG